MEIKGKPARGGFPLAKFETGRPFRASRPNVSLGSNAGLIAGPSVSK